MSEEDSSGSLSISDSSYNPLDHLCLKAQKVANLKLLTNLADSQIAKRVGLSTRKYNELISDIHFENFVKQLQHKLDDQDFGKLVKAQERHLRDRMFEEVASRFEDPDPDNDLPKDATIEERAMYAKRFAKNSDFKDLMRIWSQMDKMMGGQIEDKASHTDETELVRRVQEKRVKLVSRRQRVQQLIAENGGDYQMLMTVDESLEGESLNRNSRSDQLDSVEEVTTTLEEFSVKRK